MPPRTLLMEARPEDQPIARRGAIQDGLRIVAGIDRVLCGREQRGAREQQAEGTHEEAREIHRCAIGWIIGQSRISSVTRVAHASHRTGCL